MKRAAQEAVLRIHSQIPHARICRRYLLGCARQALHHFRRPVSSIDFIITTARKMAQMPRCYLQVTGPTDVMAFNLSENGAALEGEVYICLDQARCQAACYGVSLASEVVRLAVHGVLHLSGEDDKTEVGRARMRRLEDRVLRKVERAK